MDGCKDVDLARMAQDLQLRKVQVARVVDMLEAGDPPAFIARYRKERTGGIAEERIRAIRRRLEQNKELAERKQLIVKTLEVRGLLDPDLQQMVENAATMLALDDLYHAIHATDLPLAAAALSRGLGPLADAVWSQDPAVQQLDQLLPTFVDPARQLTSVEEVTQTLVVLLAAKIAAHLPVREAVRKVCRESGRLRVQRLEGLPTGEGEEFREYFQFDASIRSIPAHRMLLIDRGEKASALRVTVEFPRPRLEEAVAGALPLSDHVHAEWLRRAIPLAVEHWLVPQFRQEMRRELSARAEEHALQVLTRHLRNLLLQPPLLTTRVLAIDPGYRNGCQLVALDERGQLLEHTVIYPHFRMGGKSASTGAASAPGSASGEATTGHVAAPSEQGESSAETNAAEIGAVASAPSVSGPAFEQGTSTSAGSIAASGVGSHSEPSPLPGPSAPPGQAALENVAAGQPAPEQVWQARRHRARERLEHMLRKHRVQVVAIGNGPARYETEELLSEIIAEKLPDVSYCVVSEAGVRHYGQSALGREELPHVDVRVRTAVAIGRRLQNPLGEWIKIDPQHFGIGFYHQDVPVPRLRRTLLEVMESCVNSVGVDVNEASAALLRFVSGLDHLKAHQLVQWRNDHGPFRSRADLMQVPGMDAATFMRAAGFLRVYNGDHPFDETWLHPEQYPLAERILSHLGLAVADWRDPEKRRQAQEKLPTLPLDELANAWQVSRQAFQDVINELTHPGRDPRWERPGPTLRKKVLRFEDLQPGMELRGTVVNVVDFGAFVDVGLRDSCLVHISELANRYIRSPYELVSVGDVVTTWVLKVDRDKRRVSLTMMPPGTPRTRPKQPVAAKPAEAKERTEARPAKPPARRLRRRTGKPRAPKPAVVAPRASNAAETPSAAGTASPPASVSSPTQGPAPPTAPEKSAEVEQVRRTESPRPVSERVPKKSPAPRLSHEALSGQVPLRTFAELKAFYEAKRQKPPVRESTKPENGSAQQAPPAH